MNRTCIVVADGGVARFYEVETVESPRAKAVLRERSVLRGNADLKAPGASATGRARAETNTSRGTGTVHPVEAQRERHRVELESRFAEEIVRRTGELVQGWLDGVAVLVAEPQLLGLVRGPLRKALPRGVELKELAKDYAHLDPSQLHDHLARNGLVPVRDA
jgi:protein required for attachment to host cells